MVVVLSEVAYYKLKARVLEAQNREMQLNIALANTVQERLAALRDAGLDGTKSYKLSDDTLTATEVGPNGE